MGFPNIKRRRAGKIAKASGSRFENIVLTQCHFHKVGCIQIPTGSRVARGRDGMLFPLMIKTPCDFVLMFQGKAAFVDAKCTANATFTHSMLKDHQIHELSKMKEHGAAAGYLVWFERDVNGPVCFFDVEILKSLKPRESVRAEDGLFVGKAYDLDPKLIFSTIKSTAPKELTSAS